MTPTPAGYQSALRDFRQARQQAALQEVMGRLTGRSTRLLSYEEVAKKLKLVGRIDRGMQQIPVRAIVGSVGRYSDFTSTFLPRLREDERRWASVKAVVDEGRMPPIEVYKVGEVYFVLDGNHRVSIARQKGMEAVDASVTEVRTPVPLAPGIRPDDLIIKAEYAEFLDRTRLAERRPNVEIQLTAPGGYQKLLEIIEAECISAAQGDCASLEEAVLQWYDETYLLMVDAVREQGLLRWFPKRTEADLVLWICEHCQALEQELGWSVRPEAAAADLVELEGRHTAQRAGSWRKARMADRYIDRLFKDILVPLSGEEACWEALEQAIAIAAREDGKVHGLHVLRKEENPDDRHMHEMHTRLGDLCSQAGITWDFHTEGGDVATRIIERSRLTDLVVLNTVHAPGAGLAGLRSGLRSIIWKSASPLLATCCHVSPLNHALLAFDGSPKSREALFVAAYLAETWMTSLYVLTLTSERHAAPRVLDYARSYLELHEIQAEYLAKSGPVDVLPTVMDELDINLLLMGGYNRSALGEMFAGSLVNLVLSINRSPVFLCR